MSDEFGDKIARIARDIEAAIRGDYEAITADTRADLAAAITDHMEGRTRVEIPLNDRVSIEGRRERDGTIAVSLKIEF